MSDKMRWRYGDTNPVMAAVDSATVIEIGDLIWHDTDDGKPASAQADQDNKAANQQLFAAGFLGVAMQRSEAGDTAPIRVATSGAFEFDCVSDDYELGNLVGPDENTAGTALLNQKLTGVAGKQYAIARVAKRASATAASIIVDICSTVMAGGVPGTTA